MRNMQLRALKRWEFEYRPNEDVYYMEGYELKICWSIKTQSGAYFLDGQLTFINSWDMLDDIMAQTDFY